MVVEAPRDAQQILHRNDARVGAPFAEEVPAAPGMVCPIAWP